MGREIRMVPPNWDHPQRDPEHDTYRHGGFQPMYDSNYDDAKAEWIEGLRAWEAGEDDDREKYKNDDGTYCEYWDWHGQPPTRAYYRPWKDEDATWFQLWETVSEGTPVSPPFATKRELADYLSENGDFWDQKRCHDPSSCRTFGMTPGVSAWGKDQAERFVFGSGWAPSLVLQDGKLMSGVKAVTQNT